jgi:hypothetical protein
VVHRHGNGTRSLDNRIENRLSHCPDGGRSMIIHITDETLRKKKYDTEGRSLFVFFSVLSVLSVCPQFQHLLYYF